MSEAAPEHPGYTFGPSALVTPANAAHQNQGDQLPRVIDPADKDINTRQRQRSESLPPAARELSWITSTGISRKCRAAACKLHQGRGGVGPLRLM